TMASALARPIPLRVSAISAALAWLMLTVTRGASLTSARTGWASRTLRLSMMALISDFMNFLLGGNGPATEGENLNRCTSMTLSFPAAQASYLQPAPG